MIDKSLPAKVQQFSELLAFLPHLFYLLAFDYEGLWVTR